MYICFALPRVGRLCFFWVEKARKLFLIISILRPRPGPQRGKTTTFSANKNPFLLTIRKRYNYTGGHRTWQRHYWGGGSVSHMFRKRVSVELPVHVGNDSGKEVETPVGEVGGPVGVDEKEMQRWVPIERKQRSRVFRTFKASFIRAWIRLNKRLNYWRGNMNKRKKRGVVWKSNTKRLSQFPEKQAGRK